jgi:DNA (cytosine-5)-methyltransferase 1
MSNLSIRTLFCGAGGDADGAVDVDGVEVVSAMNHWQKAIDVHNANHPNAQHICADISQFEPRLLAPTDLLWASPECTNHSVAKGVRRQDAQPDLFEETLPSEAAERSRATMWDVPRFTEAHGYQAIIVENVVDARHWPPFKAWLMAMDSYGYEHKIVYLNSMHAQALGLPAPQSRDRMYVVFWKKGNPRPDLEGMQRPKAYCPTCDQVVNSMQAWKDPQKPWGRYRQQYVYRCPSITCRNQIVEPAWLPAAHAIDWSIAGQRIGDRTKPLAEKTMARIAAGIDRYWRQAGMPPIMTPVEGRDGKQPLPATMPMRTQTTRNETGIAFAPFIAELRGGGSVARSTLHPLSTVTASGNHHGLVVPYYGNSRFAHSSNQELGTLTTVDRYGLIVPSGGTWNEEARPTHEAHRTLVTRDSYAIVTRHNSSKGNGAEMSTPVHETLRTLTTTGHQSLATGTTPDIEDCLFRMLEPHEVAKGMAFRDSYIWEGTRRERVRMAGNAVTPPAARDLIATVAASLNATN